MADTLEIYITVTNER